MNDKMYDVLEICLQEIENGADINSVLAQYPDLADELRPILKASVAAKMMSAAEPAPDVMRRGRAKLLQHASEMREAKSAPRKRVIPFVQRLAIAFTMTVLFLTTGTGLVSASSSALPGENLYPVKLTWENVRLFFTFDHKSRQLLEHTFENERLHEINELLTEGRHETIRFSGVFMDVDGLTYVSGIRIMILDTTVLPDGGLVNGTPVLVTGRTNAAGFVDAEIIELLPKGTIVPVGRPSDDKQFGQNENSNTNDNRQDIENENSNVNEGINGNSNENNENVNANVNDNGNDNGNSNENGNDNENVNTNGNTNDNENENNNGNTNETGNDNNNSNENVNDNGNSNENGNENVNDNGNGNENDNGNENVNDNGNSNQNDNTNVNDNGNSNDNVNDNSNENNNNSNDSCAGNDNDNCNQNDNGNDNGNDNDNGGDHPVDTSIDMIDVRANKPGRFPTA
jgi:hypothetical protein